MESMSSSESVLSVGFGGDTRSWVASADPRKRLCGMTVAPRIPTAKAGISLRI